MGARYLPQKSASDVRVINAFNVPGRVGGALSDTAIRPSVRPSPRRADALGCRHVGCLQLSHVRTADPSADGRRSASSRTAVGEGKSSRRPRGDNLHCTVLYCYSSVAAFRCQCCNNLLLFLLYLYGLLFICLHLYRARRRADADSVRCRLSERRQLVFTCG